MAPRFGYPGYLSDDNANAAGCWIHQSSCTGVQSESAASKPWEQGVSAPESDDAYLVATTTTGSKVAVATGAVTAGDIATSFVSIVKNVAVPTSKAVIAIAAAKVTILEVLIAASEMLLKVQQE